MSSSGEIVPELADLLRDIARRIEEGSATPRDADTLARLGNAAAGEDKTVVLKLHGKRGRPALGSQGVDKQLAMARAVQAYRAKHGGSLDNAYRALSGKLGHASSPDTLKKAWQEMGPLLGMSDQAQGFILYFRRLAARGLVKITRAKR
jgi:hypothetical protein